MKGQLQSDSSQSYSSTGVTSREEGEDSRKSLSKKVKRQVFSRGVPSSKSDIKGNKYFLMRGHFEVPC
jgi:hypothetical protein